MCVHQLPRARVLRSLTAAGANPLPPACPRACASALHRAVTFNALLEACTKHNDQERAAEIMQRMLLAGLRPDDFTLEAVRPRRAMRSLLKRTFDGVTF